MSLQHDLLKISEVAAAARLTEKAIRNQVHEKRGIGAHVIRVSGQLRWPRPVVERWLRGELEDQDHKQADA